MNRKHHVSVIGAGSWGTALAVVAARAGNRVSLWTRNAERGRALTDQFRNSDESGIQLAVRVTLEPGEAVAAADFVLFVVPAQSMRSVGQRFAGFVTSDAVVVSAAKGLERGSLQRMTLVLHETLPSQQLEQICALSGPNLASEIIAGKPSATVVAAPDLGAARAVRTVLTTSAFRVYSHRDVIGVEMGGALKNVIAIGAGMADGLGMGDNAKAAFVTRGLAEIARLGVALGAEPLTFAGLAGLGDLIATTASPLSRNRRAGELLARGLRPEEIILQLGQVVEGFPTIEAAYDLARRHGVEMPITERLWHVVRTGENVSLAVAELMNRDARDERP